MEKSIKTRNALPFTGERIVTELNNHVGTTEHLHRYALALNFCQDRIVVDIACGEGYGSNLISKIAKKTIGVDISKEAINHARSKYTSKNLTFLEGSADNIPVESSSIDIVVSFETIEHHERHEEMFLEIKRILKPNGVLIISSPEKDIYYKRDANNPFHVKELTISEFKNLTQKHFKYSKFLFQKHIHGSLIEPEKLDTNSSTLGIYSGNYCIIKDSLSSDYQFYNHSFFNLAIASDDFFEYSQTTFFDGANVIENQITTYNENIKKAYNTMSFKIGNKIVNTLNYAKFILTKFI